MLVAGFDCETTGLDVTKDSIVEVAVVLWDTEVPKRNAKLSFESIVKWADAPLTPDVIAIHGIEQADVDSYGMFAVDAFEKLNAMFNQAEAIVAHNGNLFDRPIYENNCKRLGMKPVEKLWIDTSVDIEYPDDFKHKNLIYLAARHEFINPFPHAALSDVLTMLRIAHNYPWDRTIEFARAPNLVIRAEVSFHNKELAKKQGFRWEPEKKIWIKTIKEFQLDTARAAAEEAKFSICVLKGKQ